MKKKIRWGSVVFLTLVTFITFVVCPIYLWRVGLSGFEWGIFIFYTLASSLSITVGYHRLFAHVGFKAHPWVQFVLLFFGGAAFEQSALKWASLHRRHHRYTDTDEDPYNIKRGFFYAHVGWILVGKQKLDYQNVQDLQKNKLVMFQHDHYKSWSIIAGLVVPILIGVVSGHIVSALLFTVAARITLVLNSAFFINSFAHMFGNSEFDAHSSAKDHWLGGILTNGEGYHNFHHRFPSDYRNGVYWYHWDPSKWIIKSLSWVGLTWDLNQTPKETILEARQKAA